jgi:hypothetical protein
MSSCTAPGTTAGIHFAGVSPEVLAYPSSHFRKVFGAALAAFVAEKQKNMTKMNKLKFIVVGLIYALNIQIIFRT